MFGPREIWLQNLVTELRPVIPARLPKLILVKLRVPETEKRPDECLGWCTWEKPICKIDIHPNCPSDFYTLVLVHELCHAAVLPYHKYRNKICTYGGHQGPFAKLARQMGLQGNLVYTSEKTWSPQFQELIQPALTKVGACPPVYYRKNREK